MITTHYSPKDFKKGKNAITKEELFKSILEKPYNTNEKHNGTDNFVAWDSGGTKADATTSAGVSIPSDWDFDSGLSGGVDIDIKSSVKGVGTFDDGGSGYSSVRVKGKIVVNKIGNTDTTVSLKLLNFLTQVTPS